MSIAVDFIHDFDCATMGRPLSTHEIAGICIRICSYILDKIKKALLAANIQEVQYLDQLDVMLQLHISGLTKLVSPMRPGFVLPRIHVPRIIANSHVYQGDLQTVYCRSVDCLKIPNANCSCLYIRLLYMVLDRCFRKLKFDLQSYYQRWVADQSYAKCISEINDLGKTLNTCPNDDEHNYTISSLTVHFTLNDGYVRQIVILNVTSIWPI